MLSRYFHTIRHLRPIQLAWRIRQKIHRPRPDRAPCPQRRAIPGIWVAHHWRPPTMLGATHFRFLNVERQLASPADWNAAGCDKLWLYNLHYFDDLNAQGAPERGAWHCALIARWIAENPPPIGNGWEPYPLSLRIVNWIKWSMAGNCLDDRARHSLAVQVRQLERTLEYHLLGNHLFENAKALVFAGMYFVGEEAERWLARGLSILEEQVREQVLEDGGHFELSPMYHALILEGVLDLVNMHRACGFAVPLFLPALVPGMLSWLRTMSHPDGGIAFFNDAAFGIAPDVSSLEHYAASLGQSPCPQPIGSRFLRASGYVRIEQDEATLIADVAAVGPDHLPGHAHADTLSFELSLRGRRVLVNSGTSIYGTGLERLQQRGTAAHNTVCLDGVDSSEVWAGFRVARRARPRVERFDESDLAVRLRAAHDGYRRLEGGPCHWRTWEMRAGYLGVVDEIDGRGCHQIEVNFHFHPSLRLATSSEGKLRVLLEDGSPLLAIEPDPALNWEQVPGHWHPEFGLSCPNVALRGRHEGMLPKRFTTRFHWKS